MRFAKLGCSFGFFLAFVVVPAGAHATSRTWPGAAPCATTLQACIDGAVDTDSIAITATVDENIDLSGRSLTLTGPGTSAVGQFAAGRSISAETTTGTGVNLTLTRLHLTDGYVRLRFAGSGTATYNVSGMVIERGGLAAASYLHIESGAGVVNASVSGNRISAVPANLNVGLLELVARGGTLNTYATYNKITGDVGRTSSGAGILVDVAAAGPAGSGYMRLFANEVRGGFNRAGVFFSEGLFSSTASSYTVRAINNVVVCSGDFPSGMGFTVNNGSIDAEAINNTVSGCYNGINVTQWNGSTAVASVTGDISNNVITASNRGLQFAAAITAGLANDYNLINAPGNLAPLGAHTITTPAMLVSTGIPRLSTGSPGIDAADGNLLANALVDAGLPSTDADGLRRVKGVKVDIGAYESGDLSFEQVASAANTNAHVTSIDQTGLAASARLLPTRRAVAGAPNTYDDFGVWYSGAARWTIYDEDTSVAIVAGKSWNVFAPAAGGGVFTQMATAANIGTWTTQIDNPATNGLADRIVLVRHNFSLDGLYDNHPTAVSWDGVGSSGHWYVANVDHAAMPLGLGFNVYAQPPSPNAFRLAVPMGAYLQVIDHPLINQVACADVHVTRVIHPYAAAASGDFTVEYNVASTPVGYWLVRSPVPFPANTAFNVVIDPAQVAACTDRIFANGFD